MERNTIFLCPKRERERKRELNVSEYQNALTIAHLFSLHVLLIPQV